MPYKHDHNVPDEPLKMMSHSLGLVATYIIIFISESYWCLHKKKCMGVGEDGHYAWHRE